MLLISFSAIFSSTSTVAFAPAFFAAFKATPINTLPANESPFTKLFKPTFSSTPIAAAYGIAINALSELDVYWKSGSLSISSSIPLYACAARPTKEVALPPAPRAIAGRDSNTPPIA